MNIMEPVHKPLKIKKQHEKPNNIVLNDLRNLESLRKIIGLSSKKNAKFNKNDTEQWQPILMELLNLLCSNKEIGNDFVLLASHAYLSLSKALYAQNEFENELRIFFSLEKSELNKFNKLHEIYSVQLFKLIICNGFLQLGDNDNCCSEEIYKKIFETAYPHCIRYTRYTYFAFKILQSWMQRSSKTELWLGDTLELEKNLESVIFSNWDNTICKGNVVGLFASYLNVMKSKYDNFLPYLFYTCVERISWCHVTKYVILMEICNALEDVTIMTDFQFISSLINSLSLNHLCSASTKVYTIIMNKLSKDLWIATFGEHLKNYVITWESEKKLSALQVLCKCWIEPAIRVHRDLLTYLVETCDEGCLLYQSHLLRIAKKYGLAFPLKYDDTVFLDHEEEFIRLNAFAAHCYEAGHDQWSTLDSIKHFLYFNATADTTYLREGIFNYIKIFFSNVLKQASIRKDSKNAGLFLEWLHEFQLDCFEIGSCYQRKIFGLQLYKISLQFLCSDSCTDTILSKDPNFKEAMRYGPFLQREMKENGKWKFTSKENIVILFKLILDPATDIKEIASSIILDFFNPNILSNSEKVKLFTIAMSKCNSNKFFETDCGAYLIKILTKWFPLSEASSIGTDSKIPFPVHDFQSYTHFLLTEALRQLTLTKKDILKAATQNTPFYGVITALTMIGFNGGPECHFMTENLLVQLMDLAEDAVNYFLNAFSTKSSNLENSSSFQEMGLAIDEAIKNSEIDYEYDELVLSPAQQTVITCIWRSLKVMCELVVAIVKSERATDALIRRSSDLVVTVSLKCRHKGVIESSGVAVGNLTRYLCRKERNTDLLMGHIDRLLNYDFSTNINLTRRGAGLTIMFHKLIANDTRIDRPFLHYAVHSLIQFLKKSASLKIEQREANNYDDPCAMHLHFLKTLVADKQLQPQLSPYMEDISLTCFEYMTSKVFIIRNASHQLFGAIVSRLVGQNTGAVSIDFGYGYSVNYFATHFPRLAAHVLLSLQACCQTLDSKARKWQNSTSIIHVLSLLSKMFFSGCELIDGAMQLYVRQIRNCLHVFMNSQTAHVRNLAAKSMAAFVGLCSIEQEICQLKSRIASSTGFNRLNGNLLALEYLLDKQDDELSSTVVKHRNIKSLSEVRRNLETGSKIESLWDFWSRRSVLIKKKSLCYAVEAQLLRLSRKFKITILHNHAIESKQKDEFDEDLKKNSPGFFEFLDESMELFTEYISYNEDLPMIRRFLDAKCIDFGIYFLKHAPRHNRNILITTIDHALKNFDVIHPIFMEEIIYYANESVKGTFRGKMLQYADISKIKSLATKMEEKFPRTMRSSELLLFTHILSLRGSGTCNLFDDLITHVSKEQVSLTNYFYYPENLRQLIGKGLEVLLHNFENFNFKGRLQLLLAALVVMEDEIWSLRETIRNCVLDHLILAFGIRKDRVMDQIVYDIILINVVSDKTILGDICDSEMIDFFRKFLSTINQISNTHNITNPFDDNNVTPYKEDSKIINLIVSCIQQKVHGKIKRDTIFQTKSDIMSIMNFDPENLTSILEITVDEYLAQKLRVVNDVYLSLHKESTNFVNHE